MYRGAARIGAQRKMHGVVMVGVGVAGAYHGRNHGEKSDQSEH